MNPSTANPRLTPEIMAALMRRRAGGVGGGSTTPASQQVMAPNSLGGPVGPSATPLQTSPQAVPAGNIQPSMPSSGQAAQATTASTSGAPSQPASGGSDPNKVLMKALLQRLVADL